MTYSWNISELNSINSNIKIERDKFQEIIKLINDYKNYISNLIKFNNIISHDIDDVAKFIDFKVKNKIFIDDLKQLDFKHQILFHINNCFKKTDISIHYKDPYDRTNKETFNLNDIRDAKIIKAIINADSSIESDSEFKRLQINVTKVLKNVIDKCDNDIDHICDSQYDQTKRLFLEQYEKILNLSIRIVNEDDSEQIPSSQDYAIRNYLSLMNEMFKLSIWLNDNDNISQNFLNFDISQDEQSFVDYIRENPGKVISEIHKFFQIKLAAGIDVSKAYCFSKVVEAQKEATNCDNIFFFNMILKSNLTFNEINDIDCTNKYFQVDTMLDFCTEFFPMKTNNDQLIKEFITATLRNNINKNNSQNLFLTIYNRYEKYPFELYDEQQNFDFKISEHMGRIKYPISESYLNTNDTISGIIDTPQPMGEVIDLNLEQN